MTTAPLTIDSATRRVRLSPRDPAFVQNPYAAFRRLRAEAPVFFWEDYGHWCFARFAEVNALLRDRRFGREAPAVADRPAPPAHLKPFHDFETHSMLEREPPAHTRLRNLVTRAFVSRRIEALAPRISALVGSLIDAVEDAGTADLIETFATPIPVAIIAEMLGVPATDHARILTWSHDMVAMYQARRSREIEDRAVAATLAFEAFMRSLVAERRKAPRDDLVSHLVAARDGGDALGEKELIVNCILLLNAGHEATVHAIANGIATLLREGTDTHAAFVSPEAIAASVEEILRYEPPLHMFTRYALEDVEVAGVALKRGDVVGLLLGSANRDEARVTDADAFDPARPPAPHVAFGAGIHFCLGAPLARLEMQIALPALFKRLPRLALAAPPAWKDTWHFRGLEALRVRL